MTIDFPSKRIVVIGSTSSGKSTLASQLAEKIGADFIELDALHWEPNWVEAPDEVFRERVQTAIRSQPRSTSLTAGLSEVERGWVVAGNYSVVRDLVWSRAEAIIWLDYPLHIIFWRLLTRTIRRSIHQEELWNGNRERFWAHLKLWSEESLFHWLFKTYWRRKREIPILFTQAEFSRLKLIRFTYPQETAEWLESL